MYQPDRTIGSSRNSDCETNAASTAKTAPITSAKPIAEKRKRRMSRRIPKYSSDGICVVFQRRPQLSHSQLSPYGTWRVSPQSQRIVIGGQRIDRFYAAGRLQMYCPDGICLDPCGN